jgi:2-hydroxycarboxylate transporter family
MTIKIGWEANMSVLTRGSAKRIDRLRIRSHQHDLSDAVRHERRADRAGRGISPVTIMATGFVVGRRDGTGDIAILTAANRMQLMPFALITHRIGGAMTITLVPLIPTSSPSCPPSD